MNNEISQKYLDLESNQSLTNETFIQDNLMEKLKLLKCDNFVMVELKMKPLHRYYFMKTTNPGEQFYVFTSLCAWIIRKTGRSFEQPEEYDDPSDVILKIMKYLQEMEIPVNFATNRLIQGAGAACIFVLDSLANQALKLTKTRMETFKIKPEEEITQMVETDSEIVLDKLEEDQNIMSSDDDSDEGEDGNILDLRHNVIKTKTLMKNDLKIKIIDSENWRLELERVLPKLKVYVKNDPRDWRAHLEHMKTLRGNIESSTTETTFHLKRMKNDIAYVMEKIESRQKHMYNDLKNLILQYKTLSISLNQVKELLKQNNSEKLEKEQELINLLSDLETLKSKIEERGNAMTDGNPILNIKKTISKLYEEMSEMDVQIGVLDHTINSEYLRQYMHNVEMFDNNLK